MLAQRSARSAAIRFSDGVFHLRILIAGAAGFIGSHICDRLLAEGHTVVAVDNLLTGSEQNLAHLTGNAQFRFIRHDITRALLLEGPLNAVLNMASPASPKDYLGHSLETLDVGSTGTRNMLELARASGARFLQASTSECYGDPLEHPQRETYWGNVNPVGPRSCYDESKRFAEALTMAYHRTYGVRTNIARIFNTYGPRMKLDDGRVVPAFIGQTLRGEPITIFGDGSQTRSFCYVSDLVEGIYRLMQSDERYPVNLGNPNEMTVLEFAERIGRITGSSSPIVHRALPEDDPKQRKPDISKARRLLGWEPRVPLDEGLRLTVDYFSCAHMKRTLRLIGILVVLLLLAVAALPFLINPNRFRPMLEAELTKALARDVKVGDLKLAILSGGVTAGNLSIADDPTYSRTPFVETRSATLGVDLWPLIFSRHLHVTQLTLDQPRINLLQSAAGDWNFSSLFCGRGGRTRRQRAGALPPLARLLAQDSIFP